MRMVHRSAVLTASLAVNTRRDRSAREAIVSAQSSFHASPARSSSAAVLLSASPSGRRATRAAADRTQPRRRRRIAEFSTMIEQLLARFEKPFELLCTIPGVQRKTAEVIIAETGAAMSAFPTAKHLAGRVLPRQRRTRRQAPLRQDPKGSKCCARTGRSGQGRQPHRKTPTSLPSTSGYAPRRPYQSHNRGRPLGGHRGLAHAHHWAAHVPTGAGSTSPVATPTDPQTLVATRTARPHRHPRIRGSRLNECDFSSDLWSLLPSVSLAEIMVGACGRCRK